MLETRHNPEDRRTSLRIHTRLPLQWQVQTRARPTCRSGDALGSRPVPGSASSHLRSGPEFDRALHDIGDPATIAGLRLLNSKIDLIAQGRVP